MDTHIYDNKRETLVGQTYPCSGKTPVFEVNGSFARIRTEEIGPLLSVIGGNGTIIWGFF